MGAIIMDLYLKHLRSRYLRGNRAIKKQILDEFCNAHGYHRKSATRLLNQFPIPDRNPRKPGKNKQNKPEIFSLIPDSVNTPEIKIPISDEHKFSFMRDFCENAAFPAAEIIRMDGLRVEFENGWGLIRASNTTPCLVARFEAIDEANLQYIKDLFKLELQKLNTGLQLPF